MVRNCWEAIFRGSLVFFVCLFFVLFFTHVVNRRTISFFFLFFFFLVGHLKDGCTVNSLERRDRISPLE